MESPYHPHAFELWEILLDSNYLIPVEAGLQQCSFDVLNQCSLGRKQVLKRPGTILEKVMFSFIYTAGTTALAENSAMRIHCCFMLLLVFVMQSKSLRVLDN